MQMKNNSKFSNSFLPLHPFLSHCSFPSFLFILLSSPSRIRPLPVKSINFLTAYPDNVFHQKHINKSSKNGHQKKSKYYQLSLLEVSKKKEMFLQNRTSINWTIKETRKTDPVAFCCCFLFSFLQPSPVFFFFFNFCFHPSQSIPQKI